MSDADVLERRLSPAGCKLVGTQLAAELARLSSQSVALAPEVKREAKAVAEATQAIEALGSDDRSMTAVDRATDRAVASLRVLLEAVEASFEGAELLPLKGPERARLGAAQSLRKALFPRGTSYLKASYRSQWVELDALARRIAEHRAAIEALGLAVEAGRVERWAGLYGARLGVTQAGEGAGGDRAALALADWHEAWGAFAVSVRYHYRGGAGEAVRRALLRPYDQQADEERAAARRRAPRSEAPDEGPEAPAGEVVTPD
ncbi:MAG TPA: hypothetical protein VFS00_14990 [Polyangiaceae bacterium]|nr:hypothetical protein [Polyangiaceae bacterium]